jgi:hypothetical protein
MDVTEEFIAFIRVMSKPSGNVGVDMAAGWTLRLPPKN